MHSARSRKTVSATSAMVVAQLVLTGLVTHVASLSARPLVMPAVTAVAMMVIAALLEGSIKSKIAAIVFSTMISVCCVFGWRRLVDPLGFIGPVPSSLEIPALGVSALITIVLATVVTLVSVHNGRAYRFRWLVIIVLSGLVVGSLLTLTTARQQVSTAAHLQQVLQSEAQLDASGRFERQDLSFWLGVFGRGAEAHTFSTRAATAHRQDERPTESSADWDKHISSQAVPWRQAISEIAARERIVIIMEAHNATQHREWIEQTLLIFYDAGFRHYAAETLHEAGDALTERGFPVETTGVYVNDPRFGNLLRRAIELNYTIHEYEAVLATEMSQREEQQAQTLANIIAANPDGKIVIHAGFSHVFKQPVPNSGKWMAARLWEKTGIEPYSIYQAYEDYDSPNYPRLVELAGATDEPRLLMPPPSGLTDPQFADIPVGAVDAIVIHPLTKGQPPASRKPAFSSGMTQLRGRWLEKEWPIIIGAYRAGETSRRDRAGSSHAA